MGTGNHPFPTALGQDSEQLVESQKDSNFPSTKTRCSGKKLGKLVLGEGAKPSVVGFINKLKIHQEQGTDTTLPWDLAPPDPGDGCAAIWGPLSTPAQHLCTPNCALGKDQHSILFLCITQGCRSRSPVHLQCKGSK